MSWFQDLFIGFFTRHFGTKVLALLLSVGLFGFVQASLTGTQQIASLTLVPSLAEDTRGTYILLSNTFRLDGLTIRGELSKIEPLARLYRGEKRLALPIDAQILSGYPKQPDGVIKIPITPSLFRNEVLFGKDVTVEPLQRTDSIDIATLEDRRARVEVTTELASLTHADCEGQITFVPNYRSVSVRGPSVAFPPDKEKELRIVVGVKGNIGDQISASLFQGETGVLSFGGGLCEIRWPDGNIKPEYVSYLRITPDGNVPLGANEFQRMLAVSASATKKKVPVQLKKLPIVILDALPPTVDLDKYQGFPPFGDLVMKAGVLELLDVRMPAVLAGDDAFRENLVVVLDLAAHATDLTGEVLKVPYYLGLKDRSREDDLANLAQIAIAQEPHAEFRLKP